MSVLEQEIIEKFHQLDKTAQRRVRALISGKLKVQSIMVNCAQPKNTCLGLTSSTQPTVRLPMTRWMKSTTRTCHHLCVMKSNEILARHECMRSLSERTGSASSRKTARARRGRYCRQHYHKSGTLLRVSEEFKRPNARVNDRSRSYVGSRCCLSMMRRSSSMLSCASHSNNREHRSAIQICKLLPLRLPMIWFWSPTTPPSSAGSACYLEDWEMKAADMAAFTGFQWALVQCEQPAVFVS